MPILKLIVSPENEGERIDKYLTGEIDSLSRSYIQKLIDDKMLTVNDINVRSNYKVKADDDISFSIPETITPDIKPENIPIDIIYEDDDVAIVNKPQGMVVHPANGHFEGTLVNALMFHLNGRLSGINGVYRPGIVHRIDKDTSGLLIICKNDNSHLKISEQLKDHSCMRVYHAIVHGNIDEDEFTIDAPIGRSLKDRKKMAVVQGGRRAVTHVKVLERFNGYTYIECRLETGRTHQIRVHMANINHAVAGDKVYSIGKEPFKTNGQLLHAKTIGFISPTTGQKLFFDSPLPDHFEKILTYLRSNCR